MGLILDSSVLIAAERKGRNARQTLMEIASHDSSEDVAVSAITLMELTHGVVRAETAARKAMRQQFVDELMSVLPVYPVTALVALRAGVMSGENASRGIRVATINVRHFALIPGLEIVTF